MNRWNDKPYHSLNYYYNERFGEKVYKISLNTGLGCPNRDGRISHGGCIFCSEGGSGDFAADDFFIDSHGRLVPDIRQQIKKGKELIKKKIDSHSYIAYFQAYTNTYGDTDYLRELFTTAIMEPEIVGIAIATRPDCLEDDKIELLSELNMIKPVFVELGLQTMHERTAELINRGYTLNVFEDAQKRLRAKGLNTTVHVILGLPGESREDMLATCSYLADLHIEGIKLQLLHILKNTYLGDLYNSKELCDFRVMELDEYAELVVSIIEGLPQDMIIHRITGDGPKNLLIAPLWSTDKKNVLNTIMKEFARRNTWQGKYYGS